MTLVLKTSGSTSNRVFSRVDIDIKKAKVYSLQPYLNTMKRKTVLMGPAILLCCVMLSSCYTYTSVVGKGAQGSQQLTRQNHYLIDGLVTLKTSDSHEMAGGANDYSVTTTHTFLDGLVSIITFGIYAPTTTIVTK